MKCPYTHKNIKSFGNYIRYESQKRNIDKSTLKFLAYKFNYGEDVCVNFKKYYVDLLYSIPEFKKKFDLPPAIVYFLLKYHNITPRSLKESVQLIGKVKAKNTFLTKYGVSNPSQINGISEKKRKTFNLHYGVDNIWKHENYHKKLNEIFMEKYGMSRRDFIRIQSKEKWKEKTIKEKNEWLLKSIHSDESQKKQLRGYNKSKLEIRVEEILSHLCLTYTHTFLIRISSNKRYFCDFYLPDINTIIEIFGDYWHANPIYYKKNDSIHYKFKNITASDIWTKDKIRINDIKSKEYNVIVIWESEIKTDENIKTIIQKIINENM